MIIEAQRRNRINTALTRLRSLAGVSQRTEKSEVLELSLTLLEQQEQQLAALKQVTDPAIVASLGFATSPACSSQSDASLFADDVSQLPSAAAFSASIDALLSFEDSFDMDLPALMPPAGDGQDGCSWLSTSLTSTSLTSTSLISTSSTIPPSSSTSSTQPCNNDMHDVLSLPSVPRSPSATAELLQFASLQLPPLDTMRLSVPIGLSYVSSTTVILDLNDIFLKMIGYSRRDALGQSLMLLISMPDGAMAAQERSDIVHGKRHTLRTIERVRLRDGTEIWFRKTMTRKGVIQPSIYGPMVKYALITLEPMPEPAGGACVLFDPADIAEPEHPLSYENLMCKSGSSY
jgi:PAS domain S-box-containing protein